MSHEIASEGKLTYGTNTAHTGEYVNLVKDMSWVNSRNHQHTDNKGHVIGYWVDLTFISTADTNWTVSTVPNTWKMRNAFRKFHAYRDEMFKKAGVTRDEMGRYGRTIRPFFESDQITVIYPDPGFPQVPTVSENRTLVPVGCTDANREWTYTTLANEVAYSEGTSSDGLGALDTEVNTWPLMICDRNVTHTTSGDNELWAKVGMIHSYNLDRMEVVTPDGEETISGPSNPLAALMTQSAASGEIIDIAEEQELEHPPYDITDGGDSVNALINDYTRTNSGTLAIARLKNVFVPAGILKLNAADSGSDVLITAHVKGWSYCKDLA